MLGIYSHSYLELKARPKVCHVSLSLSMDTATLQLLLTLVGLSREGFPGKNTLAYPSAPSSSRMTSFLPPISGGAPKVGSSFFATSATTRSATAASSGTSARSSSARSPTPTSGSVSSATPSRCAIRSVPR
jgi:hypothetical protein